MGFHLDSPTILLFALLLMLKCREILIPSSLDNMVRTHYLATVLSLHWYLFEKRLRFHMLLREVAVDDR